MATNDYLIHYGVKGMRWGVRRYRNADGSLTNAGQRRYKYGSINVDYNRKNKSYRVSNDRGIKVDIEKTALNKFEDETADSVINLFSATYKVPMKKVYKYISKRPAAVESINETIDMVMEHKLNTVLDGVERIQAVKQKPKYSQSQAINKVYSGLEKKYPNFNKLSQDRQDVLFMQYANETGMYKYLL